MISVKLRYVNIYSVKGKKYAYYRRNGQRIRINYPLKSQEFLRQYHEIDSQFSHITHRPGPDTLQQMISDYRRMELPLLSKSSQSNRIYSIKYIEDFFPKNTKVQSITRPICFQLQEKIAEKTPRKAIEITKTLKLLLDRALNIGLIQTNPAAGIKRPKSYKPRPYPPWPPEHIELFQKEAQPVWKRAFMVLLYTAQRPGDAVHMLRSDIKNNFIKVTQSKTKTQFVIPLHPKLLTELNTPMKGSKKDSLNLIQREDGNPMTRDYLTKGMRKECTRLNLIPPPYLYGLRKNAAKALIEAGCTERQAMAITGHKTTEMIRHYSQDADQNKLADEAMEKWRQT